MPMTSNEKACFKAVLNGTSYREASARYKIPPADLKRLIEDFLRTHVPEMLASLKADGKITLTELRQHALYLNSVLDMQGV